MQNENNEVKQQFLDTNNCSVVYRLTEIEKLRCSYCRNENGSASCFMCVESLLTEDYQDFLDRGWSGSGHFLYKPIMGETCCPQYTIRCDVMQFSLTKAQKKVIRKFNKFLSVGFPSKKCDTSQICDVLRECDQLTNNVSVGTIWKSSNVSCETGSNNLIVNICSNMNDEKNSDSPNGLVRDPDRSNPAKTKQIIRESKGADPERPKCKKAKLLRLERKQQKIQSHNSKTKNLDDRQEMNHGKVLEEILSQIPDNAKHKLRTELVPTSIIGPEWYCVENTEYELYRKYQMIVHEAEDCSLDDFRSFLVSSPLKPKHFPNDSKSDVAFGSYHQQYWLDDKLIAVGVMDILPKCVHSVYFFYDPDYRSLTLGTYGALREIQFTRKLHDLVPSIQYYYMGYYIHSCTKMRYKGKFVPSYLLCPETYVWQPIENCVSKLDENKYSRLNPDPDAVDMNRCTPDDIDQIRILTDEEMSYRTYRQRYGSVSMFFNIGEFMGKVARNLLFVVNRF